MLIIGICGASGSGKSTLAKKLAEKLEGSVLCLQQDSYYRDHPDMPFEERETINYDEPEAFEHDVLREDLLRLKDGLPITAKHYDFTQHQRADTNELIEPADIVILEGIHVFYSGEVRNLLDFKIFVQVDADVCLLRRVKRDLRDRGRTIESVYKQYLESVKPMFDKYIRNYAQYADLIVPHGGKNARFVEILSHYINSGKTLEPQD